jgi:hypothetical protein
MSFVLSEFKLSWPHRVVTVGISHEIPVSTLALTVKPHQQNHHPLGRVF